jgi:hypothetical protein
VTDTAAVEAATADAHRRGQATVLPGPVRRGGQTTGGPVRPGAQTTGDPVRRGGRGTG